MSKPLPSRPNLEQLRNQAKDLLNSVKAGDAGALRRFAEQHPRPSPAPETAPPVASCSLADAQLVIAREYGFASWPKLKEHVQSILLDTLNPHELFKEAFAHSDAGLFRRLLDRHPGLKARINDPIGPFDSPAIIHVRSREMLDALLDAGADINARSRWWAGGFGLLDQADPELSAYAIERGARVDVHAAARLGMLDRLRELVAADPLLVHARGGDGQTPLHFASTIAVADFLLDHGADIDARDVDHESTPAQYMIRDRREIARFLVERGCRTDILMAAALGNLDLVRRHLDADPASIHTRVTEEFFPMVSGKAGGTIYQWTLGWYVSPHDVARNFGHDEVYQLLMQRSPADIKFLAACWAADHDAVKALLAEHPGLAARLPDASRRQVALAARNNNTAAVRVMLAAGLPVDATGQHQATPLHWAAFHGNAEMTRTVLEFHPPLEKRDADFQGTPLGWAIHGSQNGWHSQTGDYPATVELLLKAGAKLPEPSNRGTEAVQAVLHRHRTR